MNVTIIDLTGSDDLLSQLVFGPSTTGECPVCHEQRELKELGADFSPICFRCAKKDPVGLTDRLMMKTFGHTPEEVEQQKVDAAAHRYASIRALIDLGAPLVAQYGLKETVQMYGESDESKELEKLLAEALPA